MLSRKLTLFHQDHWPAPAPQQGTQWTAGTLNTLKSTDIDHVLLYHLRDLWPSFSHLVQRYGPQSYVDTWLLSARIFSEHVLMAKA